MPSPSSSLTVLRNDLSAAYEEFDLSFDRQQFIGLKITRPILTADAAGQFPTLPIEQLLRDVDTERAPRTGYNRGDFRFGMETFKTAEHGFESILDQRELKAYQHLIDAEQVSANRSIDGVTRKFERQVSSMLFNPETFAEQTTAVTHEWDDASNATPVEDVENAVQNIFDACGLWPNMMILSRKVFRRLRNCDEILDRIAAAGAGEKIKATAVTPMKLAEVFDLDHIFVGGAARNTADEGQDANIVSIWDDEYALIGRRAQSKDPGEPCTARAYMWSEEAGDEGDLYCISEMYEEPDRRGNVYRARMSWEIKVMTPATAHLLSNISTQE